jgi:hypothetical protein
MLSWLGKLDRIPYGFNSAGALGWSVRGICRLAELPCLAVTSFGSDRFPIASALTDVSRRGGKARTSRALCCEALSSTCVLSRLELERAAAFLRAEMKGCEPCSAATVIAAAGLTWNRTG